MTEKSRELSISFFTKDDEYFITKHYRKFTYGVANEIAKSLEKILEKYFRNFQKIFKEIFKLLEEILYFRFFRDKKK